MARIVHIALKVDDLDRARRFYEELFGFKHRGTIRRAGSRHAACHLSDGTIDLTLLGYDGEDAPEAQLSGAGTCIHHFGIEVSDPDAFMAKIAAAAPRSSATTGTARESSGWAACSPKSFRSSASPRNRSRARSRPSGSSSRRGSAGSPPGCPSAAPRRRVATTTPSSVP